MQVDIF